jgi:HAD superfamily hydrolase (TIGR01509 family)
MTAVIFDCDGVLVDSEVLALEIELISLKEIGLEFDIEVYQKRHLGTTSTEFFREIEEDYHAKFDAPLPNGFRQKVGKRYREAFSTRLQIIDGVHDLLSSLECPIAVASGSSPESLAVKLAQVEIASFFGKHVYSSHQVKRGKPAPDLFQLVSQALGVPHKDCIVVEDSARGIKAAVAAGMRAIGFTGGGHCLDGHGDVLKEVGALDVISQISELKMHL